VRTVANDDNSEAVQITATSECANRVLDKTQIIGAQETTRCVQVTLSNMSLMQLKILCKFSIYYSEVVHVLSYPIIILLEC